MALKRFHLTKSAPLCKKFGHSWGSRILKYNFELNFFCICPPSSEKYYKNVLITPKMSCSSVWIFGILKTHIMHNVVFMDQSSVTEGWSFLPFQHIMELSLHWFWSKKRVFNSKAESLWGSERDEDLTVAPINFSVAL